ncbi:hypothetical protein C1141_19925 [Vibrio agarivorans]|nr:hypothetical protein C1141_19925 [Vibrio agarivorans]
MPVVQAIIGFDHAGPRRKGDLFEVPDRTATELMRKGLVTVPESRPAEAVGEKPSASPAAPASPPQTAHSSENGKKRRRKRGASS